MQKQYFVVSDGTGKLEVTVKIVLQHLKEPRLKRQAAGFMDT